MRYINKIYTSALGKTWTNQDFLSHFEPAIEKLPIADAEQEKLLDAVRYFLMGQRTRKVMAPNLMEMKGFDQHANTYRDTAERSLDNLSKQILESANGVVFDAIVSNTSSGNLMPGLSYRMAARLGSHVRSNSMLLDLGNVGCTGGLKALNLVKQLDEDIRNVLVVSVEQTSALCNFHTADVDVWQGNCTFGDGSAALWVSNDPDQGEMALALTKIQYEQQAQTGLDLIRWQHNGYYTFELADSKTFNRDIREFVFQAVTNVNSEWLAESLWAIHPAGIALLTRLGRKLGLTRDTIRPSVAHYDRFSNMSSASILHILNDLSGVAPIGAAINLLSMGAGFNVIYGRLTKER